MKTLFVLASVFIFALSAEAQRAQPAAGGSMSGGSMNSTGSSTMTQANQSRVPMNTPAPPTTQPTPTSSTASTETNATAQAIHIGDCVLATGTSQIMTVIDIGKHNMCTCSWVDITKVTRQQKCDTRKLVKTTCVDNK